MLSIHDNLLYMDDGKVLQVAAELTCIRILMVLPGWTITGSQVKYLSLLDCVLVIEYAVKECTRCSSSSSMLCDVESVV